MKKRFLCLVNPRSGGNRGALVAKLLREQPPQGIEIEVVTLERGVPLPDRSEIEARFSDVLIAGGDGTFSSILPLFVDSKIEFHLLALGTGNDLPRELGLPNASKRMPSDFLEQSNLLSSHPLTIWSAKMMDATGAGRELTFLNYLSFGWDGLVVAEFDRLREGKHVLAGKLGSWGNRVLYGYSALRTKPHLLPAFTVVGAGGRRDYKAGYRTLIAANIGSIMGLGRLTPKANCGDDRLELLPLRSFRQYSELVLPFKMRSTALRHDSVSDSTISVAFDTAEQAVPLQVDGEAITAFAVSTVVFSVRGKVRVKAQARR